MTVIPCIKSFLLKNKKLLILGFVIKFALTLSVFTFAQNAKKNSGEVQIKTSAVCQMCKDRIENGLAFEKGVKKADLNLENKVLTVTYKPNKTSPEKIRMAVSKLGYDADEVPANVKAYQNLPACCKKDAAPH